MPHTEDHDEQDPSFRSTPEVTGVDPEELRSTPLPTEETVEEEEQVEDGQPQLAFRDEEEDLPEPFYGSVDDSYKNQEPQSVGEPLEAEKPGSEDPQVIRPQNDYTPKEVRVQEEEPSWLDAIASDVIGGITEFVPSVGYGAAGAVEATTDLGMDIMNAAIGLGESAGLNGKGGFRFDTPELNEWLEPKTVTGSLIGGIAQVGTEMVIISGLAALAVKAVAAAPVIAAGGALVKAGTMLRSGTASRAALSATQRRSVANLRSPASIAAHKAQLSAEAAEKFQKTVAATQRAIRYATDWRAPVAGGWKGLPKRFTQWTTQGAVLDFMAWQEGEARLSNFASDVGINNWLVDYLKVDTPEEEHWLHGRFKNLIEGSMIGGVAGEVIYQIGRAVKGGRNAIKNNSPEKLREVNEKLSTSLPPILDEMEKNGTIVLLNDESSFRTVLENLSGITSQSQVDAVMVLARVGAQMAGHPSLEAWIRNGGLKRISVDQTLSISRGAGIDFDPKRASSPDDIALGKDGFMGDGSPWAMFDESTYPGIKEELDALVERGQISDYVVHQVKARDGSIINNYVVPGMMDKDAKKIALKFGAEEVITERGKHRLGDGMIIPFQSIRTSAVSADPLVGAAKNITEMTAKEVAEQIGVTPATVRRWAKEGKIPATGEGRNARYDLESVMGYVDTLPQGRLKNRYTHRYTDEAGNSVQYEIIYGNRPQVAETVLATGPKSQYLHQFDEAGPPPRDPIAEHNDQQVILEAASNPQNIVSLLNENPSAISNWLNQITKLSTIKRDRVLYGSVTAPDVFQAFIISSLGKNRGKTISESFLLSIDDVMTAEGSWDYSELIAQQREAYPWDDNVRSEHYSRLDMEDIPPSAREPMPADRARRQESPEISYYFPPTPEDTTFWRWIKHTEEGRRAIAGITSESKRGRVIRLDDLLEVFFQSPNGRVLSASSHHLSRTKDSSIVSGLRTELSQVRALFEAFTKDDPYDYLRHHGQGNVKDTELGFTSVTHREGPVAGLPYERIKELVNTINTMSGFKIAVGRDFPSIPGAQWVPYTRSGDRALPQPQFHHDFWTPDFLRDILEDADEWFNTRLREGEFEEYGVGRSGGFTTEIVGEGAERFPQEGGPIKHSDFFETLVDPEVMSNFFGRILGLTREGHHTAINNLHDEHLHFIMLQRAFLQQPHNPAYLVPSNLYHASEKTLGRSMGLLQDGPLGYAKYWFVDPDDAVLDARARKDADIDNIEELFREADPELRTKDSIRSDLEGLASETPLNVYKRNVYLKNPLLINDLADEFRVGNMAGQQDRRSKNIKALIKEILPDEEPSPDLPHEYEDIIDALLEKQDGSLLLSVLSELVRPDARGGAVTSPQILDILVAASEPMHGGIGQEISKLVRQQGFDGIMVMRDKQPHMIAAFAHDNHVLPSGPQPGPNALEIHPDSGARPGSYEPGVEFEPRRNYSYTDPTDAVPEQIAKGQPDNLDAPIIYEYETPRSPDAPSPVSDPSISPEIPDVVYRGSTEPKVRAANQGGTLGNGYYMSPASDFAGGYGSHIVEGRPRIKNPLVIDMPDSSRGWEDDPAYLLLVKLGVDEEKAIKIIEKAYDEKGYITNEIRSRARKQGFDGIVQKRNGEVVELVAFNKEQMADMTVAPHKQFPKGTFPDPDQVQRGSWLTSGEIKSLEKHLQEIPEESFSKRKGVDRWGGSPLTKEEIAQLKSGELSVEEAKDIWKADIGEKKGRAGAAPEEAIDAEMYHGTRSETVTAGELKAGPNDIGIHVGTKEVAEGAGGVKQVLPITVSVNKPLRLTDRGDQFSPHSVASQLVDLDLAPPSWKNEQVRNNLSKEEVVEHIQSLGHDGIVYLNRTEGIDPKQGAIALGIPSSVTDAEFLAKIPRATDSVILFEGYKPLEPQPKVTRIFFQSELIEDADPSTVRAALERKHPDATVEDVGLSASGNTLLDNNQREAISYPYGIDPDEGPLGLPSRDVSRLLMDIHNEIRLSADLASNYPILGNMVRYLEDVLTDLTTPNPNIENALATARMLERLDLEDPHQWDPNGFGNHFPPDADLPDPHWMAHTGPKGEITGAVSLPPLGRGGSFENDGQIILHLFTKSMKDRWGRKFGKTNIATLVHEFGHIFMYLLRQSDKPEDFANVAKLEVALGVEDGYWKVEHWEKFARYAEAYLTQEGEKLPRGMSKFFKKMKQWMDAIYTDVNNSPIRDDIPDEIREVFGRIFNNDGQARWFTTDELKAYSNELTGRIQQGQPPVEALMEVGLSLKHMSVDADMSVVLKSLAELVAPHLRELGAGIGTRITEAGEFYGRQTEGGQVKREAQDVLKNDTVAELADVMGMDAVKLEKTLNKTAVAADNMTTHLIAGKMLLQTYLKSVIELAQKAKQSKQAAAELVAMHGRLGEVFASIVRIQRGAARTTQAGNIKIAGMDNTMIEEILRSGGGRGKIEQLADDIIAAAASGPASSVGKMLRQNKKSSLIWDMLMEFRINGLLSTMRSLTTDLIGTGIHVNLLPAERIGGALMMADMASAKEGFKLWFGMTNAIKESIVLASKAWWNEKPTLDPLLRSTERVRTAISTERIRQVYPGFGDNWIGVAIDWMGRNLVRWPSRLRIFADEFYGQITYRSHLRTKLADEALKKFDPATQQKEIAQYIADNFEAGFDDLGRGVEREAMAFARKAKFTTPLTEGLGGSMMRMKGKHASVDFLMPFMRTGVNLWRGTVSRTLGPLTLIPEVGDWIASLNPALKDIKADWDAGGARKADAIGRFGTGILITYGGMIMAQEGFDIPGVGHVRIVGSRPSDPDKARVWEEMGIQENSFEITDANGNRKYYGFGRLDPIGAMLGAAADLRTMSDHLSEDQQHSLVTHLAMVVATSWDAMWMKGFFDATAAWTQGGGRVDHFIKGAVRSFVPRFLMDNPAAQVAGTDTEFTKKWLRDDMLRDNQTIWDAFKSMIPGAWESVGYARGPIFSEPIKKKSYLGPDTLSPFPVSERPAGPDPLEEIEKLKYGFEAPSKKRNHVDLTEIPLTGNQPDGVTTAYDKYQHYIAESDLKKTMHALIFKENGDLTSAWEVSSRTVRIRMVKRVLSAFRDEAYGKLITSEQSVRDAINEAHRTNLQQLLPVLPSPVPST